MNPTCSLVIFDFTFSTIFTPYKTMDFENVFEIIDIKDV